jgi:hypothetical protein
MRQDFDQFRELFVIPPPPPLRFPGKAGHPLRHVRLESDTLLLAIIAYVHAGSRLFPDDLPHGLIHRLRKLVLVDGSAFLSTDEQIREFVIAGKAANMGHKNAIAAGNHVS